LTLHQRIVLDYVPRPHFLPFHLRRQRWSVLVCHRRAGKTVAAINDIIRRAVIEKKHDGRYGFIAPYRQQAKDIAWSYLKRFAAPLLREEPRESDLSVTLLGGQLIRLFGADNPDAIRGAYFDGVVPDEFADMRSSLWGDVLRPMLADRHGWATFIGTPKGKNEFYDIWEKAENNPEWFRLMLKASESRILPQSELDAARVDMGPDRYEQEFECSFEAAIRGAFYGDEMRIMLAECRIRPLPIEKDVRVHTAWDLGISDSTAIWFVQCVGRERRLIDYYQASGVGLDHYAQVLMDKRLKYGWRYGDHFLPHDVRHRELSTGRSRLTALAALGIEAVIVPESNVLDGINAVRKMLGRTWIDPDRCKQGIEALRQYRREYDERLNDFKQNPLHDQHSHGADALRYFACGFDDSAKPVVATKSRPERPSGATHWSA
jgi:phage terminase large subunit